MKTLKKNTLKSPEKNFLKSAPALVFVLVILLALFLADIYMANAATEKDDHKHQENEQADEKDAHGDGNGQGHYNGYGSEYCFHYVPPLIISSRVQVQRLQQLGAIQQPQRLQELDASPHPQC